MKRPEFKSGNKWMVEALNLVAEYAQRTGVNPGGRPGWSETAQGWLPPRNSINEFVLTVPWKLSVEDGEAGEVKIDAGTILNSSDSITQKLTISNPTATHTVQSGGYIAIKIDSKTPTSCEIVALEEWPEEDGYQVTFTGTVGDGDFVFVARHYPLWKFVEAATDSSTPIGPDIHGIQLCYDYLQITYGPYRTPDGEFPHLPKFIPSHRAA